MLRTSLMAQQTDDRLVQQWMDQFTQACKKLNNRDGRAQALTLWRALLLAPASGGQEFDVERVRCAMEVALGSEQEAEDSRLMFVQIALQQMEQLWGGTPQYWRNVFAPETEWPDAIKQIAEDLWPTPQDADAELSPEDHAFWRQLGLSTRQRIRQAFRLGAEEWNQTFFDLFNDSVADIQKLQNLRLHLQTINPTLSPQKIQNAPEADEGYITDEFGNEKPQRQATLSNYAQYEQVTKQITDIERLLSKRDFDKARERYLQLIQRQQSSGTADKHLAMTTANVATLFLNSGYKDIAEELYRDAVSKFPNDVVARNGLADVLKAQERYAEAETLYRETVDRFPNDVVPSSGLAEVLKAQERYPEAEALYRETVGRFPNDVVARNGLANVLRKLNRLDEAEALLSGRLSSNPEQQRFDEVVLALIEVKRGLFDKAVRRVTEAASVCVPKTRKARLLALAASIELRQNKAREAFVLMKDESTQSNDEAIRLLAWHVTLATSTHGVAAVASQTALKLVSVRAKKVEKSIFDLVNSGQSLCGNDDLFELECDLLAA